MINSRSSLLKDKAPVVFCFMESLRNTASLKKFEFLRQFIKALKLNYCS